MPALNLYFLIILQIRGILNKLTPEKFEKLIADIFDVGLDSTTILKGVILLVSSPMIRIYFYFFVNGPKSTFTNIYLFCASFFRYLKKLSMNQNTRLCTHNCANDSMKKHQISMRKFPKRRVHLEDFCSTNAEMNLKTGKQNNCTYNEYIFWLNTT